MTGRDHLSKGEITKDAIQATAQAAAQAVGEVATILSRAVGDVAGAVGGFATEVFEIRDATRRARGEHGEVPSGVEDASGPVELDRPVDPPLS